MDFTSYKAFTPPVKQNLGADIYVVGPTDTILRSTASDLETRTSNGDSLVLFGQRNLESKGFSSAPATLGEVENATVTITQPRRLSIGNTQIHSTSDVNGTQWSNPSGALVKRDYGDGNVVLYNLNDEEFRYDFYYPVFWKEVFEELENRRTATELNIETGSTVGDETVENVGFHEIEGSTYAANLASAEESGSEPVNVISNSGTERKGKKQVQNLAAAALAIIAAIELLYLTWIGEA
jgi:hypothetical protein